MTEATLEAPTAEQPFPTAVVTDPRQHQFAGWVHVGPGADACEAVGELANTCSDPLHFHAWCRLPNQFQHEDLRDIAAAAAARRRRELRDTGTDAHATLEDELDEIARYGDRAIPEIIAELTHEDRLREWGEAVRDALDIDDPDQAGVEEGEEPRKLYAGIERDNDRFGELLEIDEEKRPADELKTLTAHLESYQAKVSGLHEERMKAITAPFEQRDISQLIDELREHRVKRAADDAHAKGYTRAMWLECTLRQVAGDPHFTTFGELRKVSPEVYAALEVAFSDLEETARLVAAGNG